MLFESSSQFAAEEHCIAIFRALLTIPCYQALLLSESPLPRALFDYFSFTTRTSSLGRSCIKYKVDAN